MMTKEKIFNVSFKEFIQSPYSAILFTTILLLLFTNRSLITAKNNEIKQKDERLKQCDEERVKDKRLLQDIIFEENRLKRLKNGN